MNIDPLEQELMAIFFAESEEMLFNAETTLLTEEQSGDLTKAVNALFRAVHSIKGGAQSLGFDILAETAHKGEDFLEPLRAQTKLLDDTTFNQMLQFIDILKYLLDAYKAGSPPTANDPRITCFLSDLALFLPSPMEEADNDDLSTVYLSATIAASAIMPKAQFTLLIENLKNFGEIIHNHFTAKNNNISVVLQTNTSLSQLEKEIQNLGDIVNIKLSYLSHLQTKSNTPVLQEIEQFNTLIFKLQNNLLTYSGRQSTFDKVEALSRWGVKDSSALEWLPGGFPAWSRLSSLLYDAVNMELQHKDAKRAMISRRIVQMIWETVFSALCNRTYFVFITISDLVNNWNSHLNSLLNNTENIKIVLIDLSKSPVLETNILKKFINLRTALAPHGISVFAISDGPYTRRHLNVLEATGSLVGGIPLFSAPYQAVMNPTTQIQYGG